jgi:adenosylmethionine---8-amino-7-oxononanoate aminotransferase
MKALPENQADSASLAVRDLRVVWHPCTQMKDHETQPMIAIRRGNGAWLEDSSGKIELASCD